MENKSQFSWTKGVTFVFKHEGDIIEAWSSSFSGLEKVFCNGELVQSKRSFSKKSTINFRYRNNNFSIEFYISSLTSESGYCTLSKNNKPIQRQKLSFLSDAEVKTEKNKTTIESIVLNIVAYLLIGLLLSVLMKTFELPMSAFWIALGVIIFLHMIYDLIYVDKIRLKINFNPVFETEQLDDKDKN